MEALFLNKVHRARYKYMMDELGFKNIKDPYWCSLLFIFAGDEILFQYRHEFINFDKREIYSDRWFEGSLSGTKQRLVALAYNLFTENDYYEFKSGNRYHISPLEIFSGVDEIGYQLARNAIGVRLQFY